MHVLVVENDPFLRRLIAHGLVSEGYEVKTVGNGADALRAARRLLPDILLVGTTLAAMGAADLIAAFKKLSGAERVRIVLLLNDHPRNGFSTYPAVNPPFRIAEVVDAVGALRQ